MDAPACYSLVPLPPRQGELVPTSTALIADADPRDDDEFDAFAFLWRCFCKLAWLSWLSWLAVAALHILRRQLVELRCQANSWRAQHQRAVEREAMLAAQVRHLQAEIREWKRRLFGQKTETASATEAKTAVPPDKNKNKPTKPRSRGQQPGTGQD